MSATTLLHLASPENFAEPFAYFTAQEAFGGEVSSAILEWLESDAPWRLVETDFYEQYELSLTNVILPSNIAFIAGRPFFTDLRAKVERIFGTSLDERIDATAHKLAPGQRIRIHNDFIPGQESHRVLVQLNRGWNDAQGGFLMLFNSQDPADVHRIFPPIHDSVVGFAISPKSNHAVSTINEGERFTLVYSLYRSTNGD